MTSNSDWHAARINLFIGLAINFNFKQFDNLFLIEGISMQSNLLDWWREEKIRFYSKNSPNVIIFYSKENEQKIKWLTMLQKSCTKKFYHQKMHTHQSALLVIVPTILMWFFFYFGLRVNSPAFETIWCFVVLSIAVAHVAIWCCIFIICTTTFNRYHIHVDLCNTISTRSNALTVWFHTPTKLFPKIFAFSYTEWAPDSLYFGSYVCWFV